MLYVGDKKPVVWLEVLGTALADKHDNSVATLGVFG
jgi:hypothetical protein